MSHYPSTTRTKAQYDAWKAKALDHAGWKPDPKAYLGAISLLGQSHQLGSKKWNTRPKTTQSRHFADDWTSFKEKTWNKP